MVPVFPYLFYLAGDFIYRKMKTMGSILGKVMILFVAYEVVILVSYFHCERLTYRPLYDIISRDPNPH